MNNGRKSEPTLLDAYRKRVCTLLAELQLLEEVADSYLRAVDREASPDLIQHCRDRLARIVMEG